MAAAPTRPFVLFVPPAQQNAQGMRIDSVITLLAPTCLHTLPDGMRVLRIPFASGALTIREGDRLTTETAGAIWLHWRTLVRSLSDPSA